MRLLISTHNGLFFTDLERVALIEEGYFYGIAVHENEFIAAKRLDKLSKHSPTEFYRYSLFSGPMGPLNLPPDHFIDVHQIEGTDTGIYICNSGLSKLQFIPFEGKDINRSIQITQEDPAIYHSVVNSVAVYDDDVYFIIHNRMRRPSVLVHMRKYGDDWIHVFNYHLNDYGIHNIMRYGDEFIYNASDVGQVMRFNPEGYMTEDWSRKGIISAGVFKFGERYHPKGMALKDDTLIVGISDNGVLADRFQSPGRLAFIDLKLNEIEGTITLPHPQGGELGNINEIRVIG